MVANSVHNQKRAIPAARSKCGDSDTDDEYLDRFLRIERQSSRDNDDDNCGENRTRFMTVPESSPQKPKSILIHHENENIVNKKAKPTRFVSFTLDDPKKPFTSSIYYGVKSYLHHFYEPVNKTSVNGDSFIDDDFEFVVEPGRRRRNYWFFPSILIGAFMLIGAAGLLVAGNGSLRDAISGTSSSDDDLEIVGDQPRSIILHEKIDTWQFFGLILFCGGGIVIMLALLISAYEQECGCYNARNQAAYPSLSSDTGNSWIRYADVHPVPSYDNRIPLSEEVTTPQMDRPKN